MTLNTQHRSFLSIYDHRPTPLSRYMPHFGPSALTHSFAAHAGFQGDSYFLKRSPSKCKVMQVCFMQDPLTPQFLRSLAMVVTETKLTGLTVNPIWPGISKSRQLYLLSSLKQFGLLEEDSFMAHCSESSLWQRVYQISSGELYLYLYLYIYYFLTTSWPMHQRRVCCRQKMRSWVA